MIEDDEPFARFNELKEKYDENRAIDYAMRRMVERQRSDDFRKGVVEVVVTICAVILFGLLIAITLSA